MTVTLNLSVIHVVYLTFEPVTLIINGALSPTRSPTNPKYKLLFFSANIFFYKEKKALAFNRDRCCILVLCLANSFPLPGSLIGESDVFNEIFSHFTSSGFSPFVPIVLQLATL